MLFIFLLPCGATAAIQLAVLTPTSDSSKPVSQVSAWVSQTRQHCHAMILFRPDLIQKSFPFVIFKGTYLAF